MLLSYKISRINFWDLYISEEMHFDDKPQKYAAKRIL